MTYDKSIMEFANNTYMGIRILEVTAVPKLSVADPSARDAYLSAFADIFDACVSDLPAPSVALELLFVAPPAKERAALSVPRLFMVFRMLASNVHQLAEPLDMLKKSAMDALTGANFAVREVIAGDAEFETLISGVNTNSVRALIKRDCLSQSFDRRRSYYSTDRLDITSGGNYSKLIRTLCSNPLSAVSIQLLPCTLTQSEARGVYEAHAAFAQLSARDPAARVAERNFAHIVEHAERAGCQFQILALGDESATLKLALALRSDLCAPTSAGGASQLFAEYDVSAEIRSFAREFMYYPFNLSRKIATRCHSLPQNTPIPPQFVRLASRLTREEALKLFFLPADDGKLVGLRANTAYAARLIDMPAPEDSLHIGKLTGALGDDMDLRVTLKSLTRHMLIVGMPGSGKSTFSFNVLIQLWREHGIPFIAVEPTKREYRSLIDAIPELRVFSPGRSNAVPYVLNPFEPPEGVALENFLPSLVTAFHAAFSMPSPLDIIFLKAINETYARYGWKPYSVRGDAGLKPFGLFEFIVTFREIISSSNYTGETKGHIETAGVLRLMSLIEQNAEMYDTIHAMPLRELLSKPTIIELDGIDNTEQKSLIMALLLINIVLLAREDGASDKLKNVLLIDEAHILLSPDRSGAMGENSADASGATVTALKNMIVAIRSYGTGIIIADQSPERVTRDIVGNTDTKIVFRLVHTADRSILASTTNMSPEQEALLPALTVGEAFMHSSELTEPVRVKTPDIRHKYVLRPNVSDEEIGARVNFFEDRRELLKPFSECALCAMCSDGCARRLRVDANFAAGRLYERFAQQINKREDALKTLSQIDKLISEYAPKQNDAPDRFLMCVKLQYLRKIGYEKGFIYDIKELMRALTTAQSVKHRAGASARKVDDQQIADMLAALEEQIIRQSD